jgi:hypothetical protein
MADGFLLALALGRSAVGVDVSAEQLALPVPQRVSDVSFVGADDFLDLAGVDDGLSVGLSYSTPSWWGVVLSRDSGAICAFVRLGARIRIPAAVIAFRKARIGVSFPLGACGPVIIDRSAAVGSVQDHREEHAPRSLAVGWVRRHFDKTRVRIFVRTAQSRSMVPPSRPLHGDSSAEASARL